MGDRFDKISDDYGELFLEVFKEKGSDYSKIEKTVFDAVSKAEPKLKEIPILDIGIGDGLTIEPFVNAGCKHLTGYDLNQTMLDTSRKKFGNKIKLIQGDALDMSIFKKDEFPIIISGMCIHNIKKNLRKKFWKEILRLNPKLFCIVEKITGSDIDEYVKDYENETNACVRVFERYGLNKEAEEWIKHYEYDERKDVRLRVDEIEKYLSDKYDIKVVFEEGMWKTVLAIRKN